MTELPDAAVEEAVRLTRLAQGAAADAEADAYRQDRDAVLAEHGYAARVRDGDGHPVLVCYPIDWRVDGVVEPDRIENVERAVERPLTGSGDPDDWEAVDAHNRDVAAAVEAEHGPVHGATAAAFAAFMSNHYARPLETAGPRECGEFLEEYLPRNAWPSDEQLERARESLTLTFEVAGTEPPSPIASEGSET